MGRTEETPRRRPRAFRRAVLATVLLALPLAGPAAAQRESLFLPPAQTGDARALHNPPDRLALRSRLVAIDLGQLTGLPAVPSQDVPRTLTLNLFDDAVFTGSVEHAAPTFSGGVALSGSLVGIEEGTFTLVANGAVVAGMVRTLESTYRIHPAGGGWHSVAQIDLARLPPLSEPIRLRPDRPEFEREGARDVPRGRPAR